jgi:hypothetical protein
MNWRRLPGLRVLLPALAWTALLAVLPWWLGLPLLLALAAALPLLQHRLSIAHASLLRRALRWGLPGALFALQRALGGDAFAWGAALLGALAGYTLLVGLEAWLDRDRRRAPAVERSVAERSGEWPELAMAPVGPPAEIVELQAPQWQSAVEAMVDSHGGRVDYRDGEFRFADGTRIAGVGPQFSLGGDWFAARMANDGGVVLWDRQRERLHRLRGWHIAGWHRGQPWLCRREDDMPVALKRVLNRDDEDR